jgi:tRNA(Leu) C34 or U34 (ribose-2'-O)-methylase TrmL
LSPRDGYAQALPDVLGSLSERRTPTFAAQNRVRACLPWSVGPARPGPLEARLARRGGGGYVELMRGYFGIGAEGISKPMNLGNLIRSAHAFGASFVFLVDPHDTVSSVPSDTSHAEKQLPLYRFDAVDQVVLPKGCALIGVELLDEATLLPSFRHPLNAAYVFGPERSSLSPAMVARCDHVVRIRPASASTSRRPARS